MHAVHKNAGGPLLTGVGPVLASGRADQGALLGLGLQGGQLLTRGHHPAQEADVEALAPRVQVIELEVIEGVGRDGSLTLVALALRQLPFGDELRAHVVTVLVRAAMRARRVVWMQPW